MNLPEDLKYTKSHEWVRLSGELVTVGITDHAQSQLGELVFVELPDIGRSVDAEEATAVVESVKAVSDIYAPVSGTVTEVNEALFDEPELVNEAPYGDGWLLRVDPDDPEEFDALLSAEEYRDQIE